MSLKNLRFVCVCVLVLARRKISTVVFDERERERETETETMHRRGEREARKKNPSIIYRSIDETVLEFSSQNREISFF